jgi:hypothetical protein
VLAGSSIRPLLPSKRVVTTRAIPAPVSYCCRVDLDGDRPNLAPSYQLALDLEAAGLRSAELAERLGVPVEALPSLLALAHAKAGTEEPPTSNA